MLAPLRALCAGECLTGYDDDTLMQAFCLAVAHGGYASAASLREVLKWRGAPVPRRRAFQRASALLNAVLTSPSASAAFGARHAFASLRAALTPERWLHLHNLRVCRSAQELMALNRYLRAFSTPALAALPDTRSPWLRRVALEPPTRGVSSGPLVSVLMAARNAQATLEYAIDSLLAQRYTNLEILVCDDASCDGTSRLLATRYGGHAKVRLYRSLAQQGPYNAKNALVEHARGEFITTHDADDLALPTRIGAQVEAAQQPGSQGSLTRWLRLRADGRVVFFADGKARRLCIASLLVRKRLLLEIGGYPSARVGADLDVYGQLKAELGARALPVVEAPLILGLWASGSLTRAAGMEALESGYRSPLRRAYSERIFRRDVLGIDEGEETRDFLRRTGNYLPAQPVIAMV